MNGRSFRRLSALSRNGRLILATAALRNAAYGAVSVALGLFLAGQGLSAVGIGEIFTAALAGGALMTVVVTAVADRYGRRRMLALGAALMGLGGAVFATADDVALLGAAAMLGSISPSGKDVGPFLSIEQAALAHVMNDERRTGAFAAYNFVASMAGALGALAAGLPALLGLPPMVGYRALMWTYAAAAAVQLVLFARLSDDVEVVDRAAGPGRWLGLHRSRRVVSKLAALFALDAFAGGFVVQGLVAYWFHLRFGVGAAELGAIFFGANLLSALSYLAAAPLARRIGLLNTMVFTHLPSNVLLLLIPLMPTLSLAVAMLLARHLLSQLDVPTRQSYTMAVVNPEERSAAAGVTAVARNAASAVAPALAGATLTTPALGLPFVIAALLKIVYDLVVLATFRGLRPPEERARLAASSIGP